MFYQVDWRSLWRFPVCGVLVAAGSVVILLGGLAGGSLLLLLTGLDCAVGGMLLYRHFVPKGKPPASHHAGPGEGPAPDAGPGAGRKVYQQHLVPDL